MRRPMKRLIENTVFWGLVTAWRLATWPTSRSPSFVNPTRSEEHTSELQSQSNLVCRLLLEKKTKTSYSSHQANSPQSMRKAILATRLTATTSRLRPIEPPAYTTLVSCSSITWCYTDPVQARCGYGRNDRSSLSTQIWHHTVAECQWKGACQKKNDKPYLSKSLNLTITCTQSCFCFFFLICQAPPTLSSPPPLHFPQI